MTDDKQSSDDKGRRPAGRPKPEGKPRPEEIGGPPGPEPTRYGEWEINGRVVDF